MADDPYLRVYRRNVDDPRFEMVYASDSALATWLRLGLEADAAWPASAPLPYGVKRAALKTLQEAGLIVLQPGNRYRMPDLDTEREKRSESARNAATSRWGPEASKPHMRPQSDVDA